MPGLALTFLISTLCVLSRSVAGAPSHWEDTDGALPLLRYSLKRAAVEYTCLECKAAAAVLDTMMAAGASAMEIEDFAIQECITFDLFPADVCSEMVYLAGGEVLYVLNNTKYNYDTICGWLLGADCHNTELDPWSLSIPGGKPEPFYPEPQQPTPSVVRILHLSDLHVDLQYDEGSAVNCDHPLCCRHAFGDPGPGEEAAGHWGALGECDIPLHTLDDLLAQAATLSDADLVYVTGDLPPHDVWAQSHESNLLAINVTLELIKKYFPGIPVYNSLGNHASAPVNSFVVPAGYESGFNMEWLYEGVAEMWAPWLPEDTMDTIRLGGFFSHSPVPGLRVVSVNTNYCNSQNWWLLMENNDPVGELQWLVDTLAAAEAAGEVVHILGHIPPGGGDCDHIWSHIFSQIIARYESIIRGMFYGHNHKDQWHLLYDPATNYTHPTATVLIPGAGTTEGLHAPAFRVYIVDAGHDNATWTVLDTETYDMNLTLANQEGGQPEYTLRYTAQETYGLTCLSPTQMDELVIRLATDDALFYEYMRNYNNYQAEPPLNCY
ncbi:sphingomyelin phosphodiesterase-like isoform X2 [Eriocheir sinensis]|uniref:sphingomyelin phosphodiesterase-like isoform X2 n=1 Tax=Eriocheir sinensis TaxID=95602 RepID=UPI0021C934E3|nr:sphingomyelin phosphodiesterase-like isoform X2 [Eriocheir sinensis]